ncbi:uncharacterized protein PGTG_21105 [Puccinia graminis f. sp. tritici CRL 75-36-700-3]|uniref:Uncharacterized protein n=1 Tax=Puccinia graminis f. sp. tritici (strain CRL 75-36-700-3 / race SCCL) TaxID=418459 RepID=H6QQE5_PUCGT|nr:uncharacterized protein PGTG_21105 [Puccinia graminis f. sp. tritici CRL 75-36-700-3]EHS62557.1 hypothetical protein PGTG_21105 [Puccinia graminis f. sp. tritici CRL 75-36-700-3]
MAYSPVKSTVLCGLVCPIHPPLHRHPSFRFAEILGSGGILASVVHCDLAGAKPPSFPVFVDFPARGRSRGELRVSSSSPDSSSYDSSGLFDDSSHSDPLVLQAHISGKSEQKQDNLKNYLGSSQCIVIGD